MLINLVIYIFAESLVHKALNTSLKKVLRPIMIKPNLESVEENSVEKRSKRMNGTVRFCISSCRHNGIYDSDMLQCHLCQIWHHFDCANVTHDEAENVVVWTCQKCRTIPSMISDLVLKVENLLSKIDKLSCDNTVLLQENIRMKQLLEKIEKPKEDKLKSSDKKCETLLIGSSMVRTVPDDFYLENASVTGISEASIKDVTDRFEIETNDRTFQNVIFAVGGNDCESPKEVTTIIKDFSELIVKGKSKCDHVVVSSFLEKVALNYKTK